MFLFCSYKARKVHNIREEVQFGIAHAVTIEGVHKVNPFTTMPVCKHGRFDFVNRVMATRVAIIIGSRSETQS